MTTELALKLVCAALFALDAATTIYALTRWPTKTVEANPLVRALIQLLGVPGALIALKAGVIVLMFSMPVAWQMLVPLAGFYVWVAWNNVSVIRKRMAAT